jgi:hypothetical protein
MVMYPDVRHRVIEAVVRSPGCDLEMLIEECHDLTWNQVFLELDRLSRRGEVTLTKRGRGHYTVTPSRTVTA